MIREVEKISSGQGLWTSMQGSSTGGKDRPFDSIWEKAVSGAQKPFSSDGSESAALEEKGEQDDEAAKDAAEGSKEVSDRSSDFSSRRFSFFASASPLGASAFSSVSTNRPEAGSAVGQPTLEPRGERQPREARDAAMPRRDAPEAAKPVLKEKVAPEGESDEAKDKAEKVEAKAELRPAPLRPSPASQAVATTTSVPSAPVSAVSAPSVAAENTAGQALHSPTPSAVGADSSKGATLALGNQASAKGDAPPPESRPQLSPASASRQTSQGDPANVQAPSRGVAGGLASASTAKPDAGGVAGAAKQQASAGTESPLVGGQKAVAKVGLVAGSADEAKSSDALPSRGEPVAFDAAKARDALSDALSRGPAKSQSSPTTPQTNPAPASSPSPASPNAPAAEARDGMGRVSAAESASSKGLDASGDATGGGSKELFKRDAMAPNSARSGAARPTQADGVAANRAGAGEGAEASASANKTTGASPAQPATTGLAARDAASAASRIQSPATPNRNAGLQAAGGPNAANGGGLAAAQGGAAMNPAPASQQGGSHHQGSDGSAPQDFAASLRSAASSKGTEKPVSDPSQAFEAKVEASGARRSQAASKTSQTSYVTKTTEEIKEVVAALTKSIDRLVANRSGAMNFKISFEQGGSMTLRVSMEGGQVHTSMQTDVQGLESAVKAHWSELANDWNQKGVKLNAPQFQQSADGEQRFENLNEFAQRQERQAASRQDDGRGRSGGNAPSQKPGAEGQAAAGDSDASGADGSLGGQPDQVVSNRELKAYA